jgi:subtilase family serine protease
LEAFTLAPDASIDIGTGFAVTHDQALLLIVDPNGDIEESDNTNNQITISIAVDEAPPPDEAPQ